MTVVYSRKLNGSSNRIISLMPSGWVYVNTFVLYDKESGSMWYPFHKQAVLRCIAGPLADEVLKETPSVRTTWKKWHKKHPNSMVLIER